MKSVPSFYVLATVAALLCSKHVEAITINPNATSCALSSPLLGKNLKINSDTLELDGDIVGQESLTITCDSMSGTGELQSPKITINTKKFNFQGTIDCSGTCSITSQSPLDVSHFSYIGTGQLIINGKVHHVKHVAKKDKLTDLKHDKKHPHHHHTAHPPLKAG